MSPPLAAVARIDDVVALTGRGVDTEVPGLRLDGDLRCPATVLRWSLAQGHQAVLFFEYASLDPARRARAWRHGDDAVVMVMDALPGVAFPTATRALLDSGGQLPLEVALAVWAEVIALVQPHLALLDQASHHRLRGWGPPSLLSLLRVGFDGSVGLLPVRLEGVDGFLDASAGVRCAPGVRALHNVGLVGWILCCGDGPRPLRARNLGAALDQQAAGPPCRASTLRPDLPSDVADLLDGLVDPGRCVAAAAAMLPTIKQALRTLGVGPGAPDAGHRAFFGSLISDLLPVFAGPVRALWEEAVLVDVDDVPVIPLGPALSPTTDVAAVLALDMRVRRSMLTET